MLTWPLLGDALILCVPLVLAALGGLIQMRSGIVNIALEGQMLIGALFGFTASAWTQSWIGGLLIGAVAGALSGLVFTWIVTRLNANEIIVGLGFNLVAIGSIGYVLKSVMGVSGTLQVPNAVPVPTISIVPEAWPQAITSILNDKNALFWFAIALVVLMPLALKRTPIGVHLRATGLSLPSAEALGIPAKRIRLGAGMAAGVLAALGGAQLSLGQVGLFNVDMVAGRGYIALAAIYFGAMIPLPTALACLIFALFDALQIQLQLENVSPSLVSTLPYIMVITGLALSKAVIRVRRSTRAFT
jgi:simple sugar transport system permease protein